MDVPMEFLLEKSCNLFLNHNKSASEYCLLNSEMTQINLNGLVDKVT